MTMHFSELFKIKMGEIVPRFKLSFEGLGLGPEQSSTSLCIERDLDLNEYTNSYFDVVLNNGVHIITKIHLS